MKLDPVFTVKDNQLYKIQDNSLFEISNLKKVEVKWSEVEIENEAYNEEFLAALRNEFKAMDDTNSFAVLVPVVDKALNSPEEIELFINAFNHTARRIKDCISVTGIELPEALLKFGLKEDSAAVNFMNTLAIKHAQYLYFAKKEILTKLNIEKESLQLTIINY